MLLRAKYKDDKIKVQHIERVDNSLNFANEMRKERNNGWSKERTMRWAGSIPESLIKKYEETHPGFYGLACGEHGNDWKLRDRAIRDFMNWSEVRRHTWGNT